MMRKNSFLMLIIMLANVLLTGHVYAAKKEEAVSVCNSSDLVKLKQDAANVKVTYVPVIIETETNNYGEGDGTWEEVVFDVKVYNLESTMYLDVVVNPTGGETITNSNFILHYSDIASADGAITIRQQSSTSPVNYIFTVMSNYGTCANKRLRTIKLTTPMFNFYSSLPACEGIQDYYLCQPYVTTPVDGATFYTKVDQYKAKLIEAKDADATDDNNGKASAALSGISKHKYLIVGVVVAAGVVATVLILRRKKSVL